MKDIIHKKVFISGKRVESYDYERPIVKGLQSKPRGRTRSTASDSDRTSEYHRRSQRRSSLQIKRLAASNISVDSKFITLSFNDDAVSDVKNVHACNSEFRKFIKRLNRYLTKKGQPSLQYLAVIEFQDKNCKERVHYHMLVNMPNIEHSELSEVWGLGHVWIGSVYDESGITDYLVKQSWDPRLEGMPRYLKSRNLKQPQLLYNDEAACILEELDLEQLESTPFHSDYYGEITHRLYNLLADVASVEKELQINIQ